MKTLLTIFLFCFATVVAAQSGCACLYNGQWYPHGTKIGSLTCVNGAWK
jgi:hypothetical protein